MDKIGSVTFAGLHWNLVADDIKTKASRTYYITDRIQSTLIFATQYKGYFIPNDRIIENIYKCLAAAVLEMNDEYGDNLTTDKFLYPFSAFLQQFIETDTFDGYSGTFKLGAVTYKVAVDNLHTYHAETNGENDFATAKIILSDIDDETGGKRNPDYIRFIYIHEVTHAILNISGFVDHEEKFVKTFGIFLYEILTTLVLYQDGQPVKVWPKKITTL